MAEKLIAVVKPAGIAETRDRDNWSARAEILVAGAALIAALAWFLFGPRAVRGVEVRSGRQECALGVAIVAAHEAESSGPRGRGPEYPLGSE